MIHSIVFAVNCGLNMRQIQDMTTEAPEFLSIDRALLQERGL